MVKRWDLVNECPNCYMDVNGSGAFTQHTDYALLEAERDALKLRYEELFKWKNENCAACADGDALPNDPKMIERVSELQARCEAAEKERDALRAKLDKLRDLYSCHEFNTHGCDGWKAHKIIGVP